MAYSDIFYTIFDEIPINVFVVDDDVRIQFLNREAKKIVGEDFDYFNKRGGDVLNCKFANEVEEGCGRGESCKRCLVRNSVYEAKNGKKTHREQANLTLKINEADVTFYTLITTTQFIFEDKTFYILMVEDINELIALKGIIPMCCNCNKIRDDDDYWKNVEQYLSTKVNANFSYSLCPSCLYDLYQITEKEK